MRCLREGLSSPFSVLFWPRHGMCVWGGRKSFPTFCLSPLSFLCSLICSFHLFLSEKSPRSEEQVERGWVWLGLFFFFFHFLFLDKHVSNAFPVGNCLRFIWTEWIFLLSWNRGKDVTSELVSLLITPETVMLIELGQKFLRNAAEPK